MFKCTECYVEFFLIQDYDKHMYIHRFQNNFEFKCLYANCKKIFSNYSSFKSHIFRNHKQNNTASENKIEKDNPSACDIAIVEPETNFQITVSNTNPNNSKGEWEKHIAIIFLKLKSHYNVPEQVIQLFVDELKKLNNNCDYTQEVFLKFNSKFKNTDLQILKEFNNFNREYRENCLFKLDTSHKRRNFYRTTFYYVAPVELYLGRDNSHKQCVYHYIPVLETVKAIFSDLEFQKQFLFPESNKFNFLTSYRDGSFYEQNHFFNSSDKKIEIILYQDTFEVCNPLSSSKRKHNLFAVYMSFGNIYSYHRSKIQNIQLVLLCKEQYVKYFGYNCVLNKLIDDLCSLETYGINVEIFGKSKTIKGSLVAVIGDNLGSHQIGGFTENFSKTEYLCRYCFYSRNNLKNKDVVITDLRNPENYDLAVKNLEQDVNLGAFRGVKGKSILNRLKYFHVCNPGLPPCLAHDIFEGVAKKDFNIIVLTFVQQGIVTYNYLNSKYRYIAKKLKVKLSFPNLSCHQNNLPGTAYENMYFIIYFPFVMYDRIFDRECDVWNMFLILLEICRFVLAPKISLKQVDYLSFSIKEYFIIRSIVFPNSNLIPKHHYLMHYPSLIKQFGPLIDVWTMHFEQKHQYFKSIVQKSKNWKNITKTLAERHQMLQGLLFNNRFSAEIKCDKPNLLTPGMFDESFCPNCKFVSSSVEICGTLYKKNYCVIVDVTDLHYLKVLQIKYIFLEENYKNVYFYGTYYLMLYNYKSGLYEVIDKIGDYKTVSYKDLISILSCKFLKINDKLLLSLPYSICK